MHPFDSVAFLHFSNKVDILTNLYDNLRTGAMMTFVANNGDILNHD